MFRNTLQFIENRFLRILIYFYVTSRAVHVYLDFIEMKKNFRRFIGEETGSMRKIRRSRAVLKQPWECAPVSSFRNLRSIFYDFFPQFE